MEKLYNPAIPCKGTKTKKIRLDVLISKNNEPIEVIPCSDGIQLFSSIGSFWIKKEELGILEKKCNEKNVYLKRYEFDTKKNDSIKNKDISWFSYSPTEMEIEITNSCNLKCIHCATESGINSLDSLTFEEIKDVISQFRRHGGQKLKITGGEPLCNKNLIDILEFSKKEGIKKFELVTNGTLLNLSIVKDLSNYLSFVNVSLNGASKEVHDNITQTKGSFDYTLNGIHNLKKEGIAPVIYFTVMKENFRSIPKMFELADSLNVKDLRFSLVRNIGRAKDLEVVTKEGVNLISQLIEKSKKGNVSITKSELYTKGYQEGLEDYHFYGCNSARNSVYIKYSGDVQGCALFEKKIGNLREKSLINIWYSKDAFELRKNFCGSCENDKRCGGSWTCGGPCKAKKN